jgi:hypothetical protein
MKQVQAKYAGPCDGAVPFCDGIKAGDSIVWAGRGRAWHTAHGPTGVDGRADSEYMAGLNDYNRWKSNVELRFGLARDRRRFRR